MPSRPFTAKIQYSWRLKQVELTLEKSIDTTSKSIDHTVMRADQARELGEALIKAADSAIEEHNNWVDFYSGQFV